MRLLRVWYTVRALMVTIALVAVSLAAWRTIETLRARSFEYQLRAGIHACLEEMHAHPQKYDGACFCFGTPFRPNPKLDSRLAEYHASLRRTYEYAADHPWLPVEVDPPKPE